MQLYYLLFVIVVNDFSDIKVMSSNGTVIFAITLVVNNYNIQTKPHFFELNTTKHIPNQIQLFFQKPNGNQTEI